MTWSKVNPGRKDRFRVARPEVVTYTGHMRVMAIAEFKAKCLAVLEEVANSESSLTVTKRGKPIARVIPISSRSNATPQAELFGTMHEVSDDQSSVFPSDTWDMNALYDPKVTRKRKR